MLGVEGAQIGVPALLARVREGLSAQIVARAPQPDDAGGVGNRRRRGEAVLGVERLHRPGELLVPEKLSSGRLVAGECPYALRRVGRVDQRRSRINRSLPDDRRRMARAGKIDRPGPVGSGPAARKAPRSPLPRSGLAAETGPVPRRSGSVRRRVGPRVSRADEQKPHRQPSHGDRKQTEANGVWHHEEDHNLSRALAGSGRVTRRCNGADYGAASGSD